MNADGSDQGLGFPGFRLMVSDISEELALAERLHDRGQEQPPTALTQSSENIRRRSRTSRANWPLIFAVGGGAIAVVIWLNSSGNSTYTPEDAATYQTYDTPQSDSGHAEATSPAVTEPPSADTTLAPATTLNDYAQGEVRPEIAQGATLNRNQIEYCLAENIRIETSEPFVDGTSNEQISRFNSFVLDYNSRCSNFNYFETEMRAAKSAVEARRSAIQQEGASRFP